MTGKICIEIKGRIETADAQNLKSTILNYCVENNVDGFSWKEEDEFGLSVK